jgi:hypothetical protein
VPLRDASPNLLLRGRRAVTITGLRSSLAVRALVRWPAAGRRALPDDRRSL